MKEMWKSLGKSLLVISTRRVEPSFTVFCSSNERQTLAENLTTISEEEGFLKSTWTIDLAYVLQRFGTKHLYCTETLGVDPGYSKEAYYRKVLTKDEKRVEKRFQNATANGVQVCKKCVTLAEILDHLKAGFPAIVLVNDHFLFCSYCSNKFIARFIRSRKESRFCGHYIVVCGYNLEERRILYRNPSLRNRICAVEFDIFEKARQSYGTDQDIIFIFN